MGIFRDAAFARGGNGLDGQAFGAAGTVHIQQPAAAAVVGQSVDVIESAHARSLAPRVGSSANPIATDCMASGAVGWICARNKGGSRPVSSDSDSEGDPMRGGSGGDSLWAVMRGQIRRNALALLSVCVALTSVSYTTWRNERTEYNRNVRAATFQLLTKLADFERTVFLAQYDRDRTQGNPRIGWTEVIVIHDLASVAPAPLESKAAALRAVWRTHWEQLGGEDETAVDSIEAAVEDLRQATLNTVRALR